MFLILHQQHKHLQELLQFVVELLKFKTRNVNSVRVLDFAATLSRKQINRFKRVNVKSVSS